MEILIIRSLGLSLSRIVKGMFLSLIEAEDRPFSARCSDSLCWGDQLLLLLLPRSCVEEGRRGPLIPGTEGADTWRSTGPQIVS
ncbi:hypothetical protein E2C01_057874 [Portunus trituberculatus]|uniref:Uncharacterized protein n=1 Tax=Portunus trituberculatus TaxID=210409 RepID=A0A5B7GU46_PORTR|nr:hypothetical protein [Portunus trituberculatus]